ncbi:hypothetical protein JWG39_14305 [Desulforhopalus vacuolatus]|uniref:hypothetical protein n=1 Tax=Desulforhopalus vacuolatus TaxID=40414 RepID=UPI0019644B74|nr:hypothetical protein [Desulforhopalus vacuolatus]MBM9520989.1 hypothetical protein [Desulforhopalus vacuolatus]
MNILISDSSGLIGSTLIETFFFRSCIAQLQRRDISKREAVSKPLTFLKAFCFMLRTMYGQRADEMLPTNSHTLPKVE